MKVTKELVEEVCEELVDSSTAARILGVTQTSIQRYVLTNKIFGVKVGSALLLIRSDVEKFDPSLWPTGRPKKQF